MTTQAQDKQPTREPASELSREPGPSTKGPEYTRSQGELVLAKDPPQPLHLRDRLNAYAFRDPQTLEWVYCRLNPRTGQLIHPTRGYDICGVMNRTVGWSDRYGVPNPVCMMRAGEGTNLYGDYGRCHIHANLDSGIVAEQQLRNLEQNLGIRQARNVVRALGTPVDVNPVESLLFLVREAAGNVAFLGARVQDMGYDLVGPVYSLTRDGDPVATSEDLHAMVKLYNEERDRLARVSKIALDAGIEERQVRVVEEQAALLVTTIRAVFDNLGLSEKMKQRALSLLSMELRRLDEKPIEGAVVDVTPEEATG